jgi:8-oxo-dGTP pyrophosphatase MutT (NUDIX family)
MKSFVQGMADYLDRYYSTVKIVKHENCEDFLFCFNCTTGTTQTYYSVKQYGMNGEKLIKQYCYACGQAEKIKHNIVVNVSIVVNVYNDYIYFGYFPKNKEHSISCVFEKPLLVDPPAGFRVVYENSSQIVYSNEFAINKIPQLEDNTSKGSIVITQVRNTNRFVFVKSRGQTNYTFPQGYKNVGETYESCAHRELQEETGIPQGMYAPLTYICDQIGTSTLYTLQIPRVTKVYHTTVTETMASYMSTHTDDEIEHTVVISLDYEPPIPIDPTHLQLSQQFLFGK